jgi:hypothetical protein
MAAETKLRIGGDESAPYVVPDNATADIFSSIQMHFGLVPEHCILGQVGCWVGHNGCTLALAFNKALFI